MKQVLLLIKEKLGKKDFLLNRLFEDIEILSNFFDTFIIVDARLVDELIKIKEHYSDVITIKVNRNNFDNGLTNEESNHITENDFEKYNDFDYMIENSSEEELKKKSIEILEAI